MFQTTVQFTFEGHVYADKGLWGNCRKLDAMPLGRLLRSAAAAILHFKSLRGRHHAASVILKRATAPI
jgi:hypothetical protein